MGIYCIGDIHGKFPRLVEVLKTLPEYAFVICVGDIGLGFADSLGPDCLAEVDFAATQRNQKLILIRGNHDNPEIWTYYRDEWNTQLQSIEISKDVDRVQVQDMNILLVGGAVSIDRSQEHRVEGFTWWKGEGISSDALEQIEKLVILYGQADLLVTHAGACGALPMFSAANPDIAYYAGFDSTLVSDISEERDLLTQIVQASGANSVTYGHYHESLSSRINGVGYRCCAELEPWQFMKRHSLPPLPQS